MSRTAGPTPPASPVVGDEWEDTSGRMFVYTARASGPSFWIQQLDVPPLPATFGQVWTDSRGYIFVFGPAGWVQQVTAFGQQTAPPPPQAAVSVASPGVVHTDVPNCTTGPSPPVNPKPTDLWFDSVQGWFFVFYDDGNTQQWVVANPGRGGEQGPQGLPGTSIAVGPTPPLNPEINDLWVDTS